MGAYTILEPGEPARYYDRNCDLYGHRFAITTDITGDTIWTCTHCGYMALECPHDTPHAARSSGAEPQWNPHDYCDHDLLISECRECHI